MLGAYLEKFILSHADFGSAIAALVSSYFSGPLDEARLYEILRGTVKDVYENNTSVKDACWADLTGILARDPACEGLVHAFLNFKGFKALASHRMAHVLWKAGRKDAALAIQSRCGELYSVDIHPAARIGPGTSLCVK